MIVSMNHDPSLPTDTIAQPRIWPGYSHAQLTVPTFSFN
jgi:hypothetical protein